MNDILRCSIDAVESNFNIHNSSKMTTHKKKVARGGSNKLNAPASYVNRSLDLNSLNQVDLFTKQQSGLSMQQTKGQAQAANNWDSQMPQMMPRFSSQMNTMGSGGGGRNVNTSMAKTGGADSNYRAKYYKERMLSEQLSK